MSSSCSLVSQTRVDGGVEKKEGSLAAEIKFHQMHRSGMQGHEVEKKKKEKKASSERGEDAVRIGNEDAARMASSVTAGDDHLPRDQREERDFGDYRKEREAETMNDDDEERRQGQRLQAHRRRIFSPPFSYTTHETTTTTCDERREECSISLLTYFSCFSGRNDQPRLHQ